MRAPPVTFVIDVTVSDQSRRIVRPAATGGPRATHPMSTVLVLTPAYCTRENRRWPLLRQTIYWVQRQTHADYVHVVVVDGSTAPAPDRLDRLGRWDPKLRVVHRENGGSSAAINHGLEQALSEVQPDYITVCHSDDVMLPESLDLRVRLAQERDAAFVYTDEVVVDDRPGAPPRCGRAPQHATAQALFSALLRHEGIPYVTMLWRTEFFLREVKGYDARLTSAEDWDIALRTAQALVATGARHAPLARVTMLRRIHEHSLRRQNIEDGTKLRCYEHVLGKHLEGDAYQRAIAAERDRLAKLRPPVWRTGPQRLARRLLPASVRTRFHRRPPPQPPPPPAVQAFLRQLDSVDYDAWEALRD